MENATETLTLWNRIDYFNKTMGCYTNSDKVFGILSKYTKMILSDTYLSNEVDVRKEFQKIRDCVRWKTFDDQKYVNCLF